MTFLREAIALEEHATYLEVLTKKLRETATSLRQKHTAIYGSYKPEEHVSPSEEVQTHVDADYEAAVDEHFYSGSNLDMSKVDAMVKRSVLSGKVVKLHSHPAELACEVGNACQVFTP